MPTTTSSKTDSLSGKPLPAPPALAVRAALALRRRLLRAADAVVPPALVILEKSWGFGGTAILGELARRRIPDLIDGRPMTSTEIAEQVGADPDAMRRVMRAALGMGFFERDASGCYTNNRLSRALISGRTTARAAADWFTSNANARAWAEFAETLNTGKNAFERVHGEHVWSWYDQNPNARDVFAQMMLSATFFHAPGLVASYPFENSKRVCDVGGGAGALLSEVLVRHSSIRGILYDSAGALEAGKELLAQRGVLDRVELIPGSFLESVPKGCDTYLLKTVLHDWDDTRAKAILAKCRAAMEPGAKLLVIESLVDDTTQGLGVWLDILMMTIFSDGRERSGEEYKRLLEHSGFRVGKVIDAPTPMSIIESFAT